MCRLQKTNKRGIINEIHTEKNDACDKNKIRSLMNLQDCTKLFQDQDPKEVYLIHRTAPCHMKDN